MTFSTSMANLSTAIGELWDLFPVPLKVILLGMFAFVGLAALLRILTST